MFKEVFSTLSRVLFNLVQGLPKASQGKQSYIPLNWPRYTHQKRATYHEEKFEKYGFKNCFLGFASDRWGIAPEIVKDIPLKNQTSNGQDMNILRSHI